MLSPPENALIQDRRDAIAKKLTYWIPKGLGEVRETFGITLPANLVLWWVKGVKLLLSAP